MNLEVAIEHLLIGPLIILISYIFANYPLKKINNFMGTKLSDPCENKTVGILQIDTVFV